MYFSCIWGSDNGELTFKLSTSVFPPLKSQKTWGCYYVGNLLKGQFVMVAQFEPRFESFRKYAFVFGACPVTVNNTTSQSVSSLNSVCRDLNIDNLTGTSRKSIFKGSCSMALQYNILRILRRQSLQYAAEIQTLGSDKWRRVPNDAKHF